MDGVTRFAMASWAVQVGLWTYLSSCPFFGLVVSPTLGVFFQLGLLFPVCLVRRDEGHFSQLIDRKGIVFVLGVEKRGRGLGRLERAVCKLAEVLQVEVSCQKLFCTVSGRNFSLEIGVGAVCCVWRRNLNHLLVSVACEERGRDRGIETRLPDAAEGLCNLRRVLLICVLGSAWLRFHVGLLVLVDVYLPDNHGRPIARRRDTPNTGVEHRAQACRLRCRHRDSELRHVHIFAEGASFDKLGPVHAEVGVCAQGWLVYRQGVRVGNLHA